MWWVYFHFAADAVRHSLATAKVQLDIVRLVFSYGHLSFIASIIVVAVGLRESVANPGDDLSWGTTGLLFDGTALYLETFGFTGWTMFRLVSVTRLTAAAAVLPLAHVLPALASVSILAAVVITLNVVELLRVNLIGWQALVARRDQRCSGDGCRWVTAPAFAGPGPRRR